MALPPRFSFACLRAVFLSTGLLAPCVALADAAGDERYLRLEQAERFYRRMPEFAAMQWPLVEVKESPDFQALRQRGRALAAEIYVPEDALDEMRAALATIPGEVPAEIEAIGERMRAVEAEIASRPLEELQAGEAKARADYEARPDRAAIDAVSEAMAAPDLAAETAVTGLRVKRIYEPLLTGSMTELRAMSPQEVEKGLRDMLNQARAPDGEGGAPPLRRDFTRESAKLSIKAVLSRLPESDVAALAALYASEAGRARRAALVQAFRLRNDENAYRFAMRLVTEKRAEAP